jgi:hypothetical protein
MTVHTFNSGRRRLITALFGGTGSLLSAASKSDSSTPLLQSQGKLQESIDGPWGRLRYYHFYLEAPDHLIRHFPPPGTQTRWTVPVDKTGSLETVWHAAGLGEDIRKYLTNPRNIVVTDGLHTIFPEPQLLLAIQPEQRAQIYRYLARYSGNPYMANPVLFPAGNVDEWAQDTGLGSTLIDLIKKLSYPYGSILAFSDIPLLLSQCTRESEARNVVKRLTRSRTVIARIEVNDHTDQAALLDYWSTGLGLRRNDIEPLILSAIRTRDVQMLDILHLLPPLPRKLLYTYPDLGLAVEGRFPDCHWTSLNFFNYSAESIYLDDELATSAILERFERVLPPYQFGDILIFLSSDDTAHHSCTYIAADLVFSKNGRNPLIPWTLSRLEELTDTYPEAHGKSLRIQGFRARAPS